MKINTPIFVFTLLFHLTAICQTTPTDEHCQQIHLPGGWFTYSSYVQAENMDAEVVMTSIADNLLILKNNNGDAHLTEWDFNGIGDLDFRQAYQIKTPFC